MGFAQCLITITNATNVAAKEKCLNSMEMTLYLYAANNLWNVCGMQHLRYSKRVGSIRLVVKFLSLEGKRVGDVV
jgi:hypothetical protein